MLIPENGVRSFLKLQKPTKILIHHVDKQRR